MKYTIKLCVRNADITTINSQMYWKWKKNRGIITSTKIRSNNDYKIAQINKNKSR